MQKRRNTETCELKNRTHLCEDSREGSQKFQQLGGFQILEAHGIVVMGSRERYRDLRGSLVGLGRRSLRGSLGDGWVRCSGRHRKFRGSFLEVLWPLLYRPFSSGWLGFLRALTGESELDRADNECSG